MTRRLIEDVRARLARVKLLVLDVDGVLTDGSLYYTERGEEIKKFHVRDGQGIKLVQRARGLGIMHVLLGTEDKLATLEALCIRLGLSLTHVAYVGDDVNDLPALRAVGCPCTVADARPENRACAIYVTHLPGGQGAVREICDLLVQLHTPS